jgi:hypothetical protein
VERRAIDLFTIARDDVAPWVPHDRIACIATHETG